MLLDYSISDVAPYINWDYFFYAWGMHTQPQAERDKLQAEAESVLAGLQDKYRTHALFQLFDANSQGDDIVLAHRNIPLLRQQQPGSQCLSLADFVRPKSSGVVDRIGVFATSVDMGLETDFAHDAYQKMMVQLLADRLAEATAERMHEEVRKTYWGYAKDECLTIEEVRKHYWGYAPDEQLTMQELHVEKFQGIRPAVGYPSLPDTSLNFVIDELIGMRQIGIRLTESGAMKPHASVSGLMIAHPQARYFMLGKIGEDQLADSARRRGLPVEMMRKFLGSNL